MSAQQTYYLLKVDDHFYSPAGNGRATVMNATKVLGKCAEDVLDSLGESTMQTISWQMSKRGVEMAPDNFDIRRFAIVLNELLGTGSETILNMICRNLCERLKTDFPADPKMSALEKISRIMETKKMK